jgi:hypothetical protein
MHAGRRRRIPSSYIAVSRHFFPPEKPAA